MAKPRLLAAGYLPFLDICHKISVAFGSSSQSSFNSGGYAIAIVVLKKATTAVGFHLTTPSYSIHTSTKKIDYLPVRKCDDYPINLLADR